MSYPKRVFWAGTRAPHRLVQLQDAGWSVYGGLADGGDWEAYQDWGSWWHYLRGRLLADQISLLVAEQGYNDTFCWDTSRRANFSMNQVGVVLVDLEGPQSFERIVQSGWANFAWAIGTNAPETAEMYRRHTNSPVFAFGEDAPISNLEMAINHSLTKSFNAKRCCRKQPL
jgi:hypothetical protein